jgi:hypothetical protein
MHCGIPRHGENAEECRSDEGTAMGLEKIRFDAE